MKLKDFKLASKNDIAEARRFPNGQKCVSLGGGILTGSPGDVHKLMAYKIMHETFGPPNTDFVGEKSNWEWILKTDKGLLSVYDYKGWWSIGYVGTDRNIKKELIEYASMLKDAILEEANKFKITKKQIKDKKIGGIITNPYSLFFNTAEHLLDEAQRIITDIRNYNKDKKGSDLFTEELNKSLIVGALFRSAFVASYLGFEGFINVIYNIFLDSRYRNDIFENKLKKEMIPIKLLEIDKYCNGFTGPVILVEDELFKAFQYLTNIRNDFVHANIVKDMESHLVIDKQYPIFAEEKTGKKYGISYHPAIISNLDVIRTRKLIEKIVIKIINTLDKRIKMDFAIVHTHARIFYIYNKKGQIFFPLEPDDYRCIEEIEEKLDLSPELDDEYYNGDEEEYIPPGCKILY